MGVQFFSVDNVKCDGCAANIQNALRALPGVEAVEVEVASGKVTVSGDGEREMLATALAAAGYPEKS